MTNYTTKLQSMY